MAETEVKLTVLQRQKRLAQCSGCENNFYNGNNPYGVTECWSLKSMEIIKRKRVPMSQVPPWTQKPVKMASCFHQKGYAFINCEESDRQY
jgi:hypothetical protein